MCWFKLIQFGMLSLCCEVFTTLALGQCPDSWLHYDSGGTCYYLSSTSDLRDFNASWERCLYLDGKLASVSDPTASDVINNRVIGEFQDDYWVGLWKTGRTDGPLDVRRAGWTWLGGQPYTWLNWYSGYSDEPTGESGCARVRSDGYWGDTYCFKQFRYICEKEASPDTTDRNTSTMATSTVPAHVPAGISTTVSSPSETSSSVKTSFNIKSSSSSPTTTSSERFIPTGVPTSNYPKTSSIFRLFHFSSPSPSSRTTSTPPNIGVVPYETQYPPRPGSSEVVPADQDSGDESIINYYVMAGIPSAAALLLIITLIFVISSFCKTRRMEVEKTMLPPSRRKVVDEDRIVLPYVPTTPPASLADPNDIPEMPDVEAAELSSIASDKWRKDEPLACPDPEPYIKDFYLDSITDLYD